MPHPRGAIRGARGEGDRALDRGAALKTALKIALKTAQDGALDRGAARRHLPHRLVIPHRLVRPSARRGLSGEMRSRRSISSISMGPRVPSSR